MIEIEFKGLLGLSLFDQPLLPCNHSAKNRIAITAGGCIQSRIIEDIDKNCYGEESAAVVVAIAMVLHLLRCRGMLL